HEGPGDSRSLGNEESRSSGAREPGRQPRRGYPGPERPVGGSPGDSRAVKWAARTQRGGGRRIPECAGGARSRVGAKGCGARPSGTTAAVGVGRSRQAVGGRAGGCPARRGGASRGGPGPAVGAGDSSRPADGGTGGDPATGSRAPRGRPAPGVRTEGGGTAI